MAKDRLQDGGKNICAVPVETGNSIPMRFNSYGFCIWILLISCVVLPVLATDDTDDEETMETDSAIDIPQTLSTTERLHDRYLEALDYYQGMKVVEDDDKAFILTTGLAEEGSYEAQHLLAFLYEQGIGVSSSSRHAVRWLERSSELGSIAATYDLAIKKYYGKGTKRDYPGAYKLFEKVANTPELALHKLDDADRLYALKPNALYLMASMQYEGKGMDKDVKTAIEYLQKAASHGHHYAQIVLFATYSEGKDVEADQEKANYYSHLAIDGYKDYLATNWQYAAYQGFSKETATERVSKAAKELGEGIQGEFDEIIAKKFKTSKNRKPEESALWFLYSAESGKPESMTTYGALCYKGIGVEPSSIEARKWFEKAAEAKDGLGSYNLAIMLRNGEGGEPDGARASELMEFAVKEEILPAIRLSEDPIFPPVILSPEEYVASMVDFLPGFASTKQPIHVRAYYCLAECYFTGYGVDQDLEKAVRYWKRAGNRGYAPANARVADYYFNRWYWPLPLSDYNPDLDKIIKYARKAAEGGNADGAFRYAYVLSNREKKPDVEEAIRYYKLAVEWTNHTTAANNLGVLFNDKESPHYDPQAALHYYTIGAEGDEPYALYNLGRMLLNGDEQEENREKALGYLRRSAEADYPACQFYLAGLYLYGESGVTVDLKEGVFWLSEAAHLGYRPAINGLAKIMLEGPAEFRDPTKAGYWYRQLASYWSQENYLKIAESAEFAGEFGQAYSIYESIIDYSHDRKFIAQARHRLGLLLETGKGCPPDTVKARKLYAKAARYGLSEAHCDYGRMLYLGIGGKVDKSAAIKHLSKAIKAGYTIAELTLGTLYMMDEARPAFNEEAMKLLRAAAEKDNHKAQSYLGIAYLKSEPFAPDAAEARKWLETSAQAGYEPSVKALRILDKKEGRLPAPESPKQNSEDKPNPDDEPVEEEAPNPKPTPTESAPHSSGYGVPA